MKRLKSRKITTMVSVITCLSMIFCSNVLAAENYNDIGEEKLIEIQISDNTKIALPSETMRLLEENDITIEQVKSEAMVEVSKYLLDNELSISEEPIKVNQPLVHVQSYPPGSTSVTYSGSNTGKVWARIPAIGWNYIYIPYSYNYTKWTNTLYKIEDYVLNSGSVGKSYFNGPSIGTWEHLYGTVKYVKSSYGKNLEVVATGNLRFSIPITIKGIKIPMNVTTKQSFKYFHAV
jgi:hypothetical protein